MVIIGGSSGCLCGTLSLFVLFVAVNLPYGDAAQSPQKDHYAHQFTLYECNSKIRIRSLLFRKQLDKRPQ